MANFQPPITGSQPLRWTQSAEGSDAPIGHGVTSTDPLSARAQRDEHDNERIAGAYLADGERRNRWGFWVAEEVWNNRLEAGPANS